MDQAACVIQSNLLYGDQLRIAFLRFDREISIFIDSCQTNFIRESRGIQKM